ncbi:hypothetical protein HYT56_04945 [Candidatus Woesearchaeota archaeon]|nr:hypothetical protein [Candidatus Woesearchaeota archaeon]
MNERRRRELEEKLKYLAEVKGRFVDVERCFRELYPYESKRCSNLRFNGWYIVFTEGFYGMPNSSKGKIDSVYEEGQATREIVFGSPQNEYEDSDKQTIAEKLCKRPSQEKRNNRIILRDDRNK